MAPKKPRDKFLLQDRIAVTSKRSKNFGRTGTVISLGLRRITVDFDDELPGKYVDYSHATTIETNDVPREQSIQTDNSDKDTDEISRLLEHLAFTTAITISSTGRHNKRSAELTAHFDKCLRAQLAVFGQPSTDGE
jgi:hypothetical protein